MIEAVLFDFGGVFTPSPFHAVGDAGLELGIPLEQAVAICFGPYDTDGDHPWHRLERGELSMADARAEIIALAKQAGCNFDPFDALRRRGAGDAGPRDGMVAGVRALRARGLRTAIVTNNIAEYRDAWRQLIPVDELFDVIVDSCEVGIRKPDARIYAIALDRLGGIAPERAVLLDDAPGNIASAKAAGLHAILVGADPLTALADLDALLG